MSISTLSFNTQTRTSLTRLQTKVAEATQEMNSGRLIDVGKTLGRLTGSAVSARAQETSFEERVTSNSIVEVRLKTTDASLASIQADAEGLANDILASGVTTNWGTISDVAASSLQQLTGALNATSNGQYVFGGINTDEAPITAYAATVGTSPLQQARNEFGAFLAAAGKTPSTVTASEVTAFLTTGYTDVNTGTVHTFNDLFTASWSNVSEGAIESRISKTETVVSSASANDPAFRSAAAAYTALATFGLDSLNADARGAVTEFARASLTSASGEITTQRAAIGTKQNRIEAANTELKRQQDITAQTLSALEEVDYIEAGQRATTLKSQLDAAFAVTGKIQSLSILNYI